MQDRMLLRSIDRDIVVKKENTHSSSIAQTGRTYKHNRKARLGFRQAKLSDEAPEVGLRFVSIRQWCATPIEALKHFLPKTKSNT